MLTSLRDLYQHQLAELRQAEMKYLETLPTLQSAAYSYELGRMIHHQVQHTQEHIRRLDTVLKGNPPLQPDGTSAVASLAQGCLELSRHPEAFPDVRDAALIAAMQHVRHDQIAGYGCARTWAQVLGDTEASAVLQKCLSDEKNSDAELSRIAEDTNQRAAAALVVA